MAGHSDRWKSYMPPPRHHQRVNHDRRSHRRYPVSVDIEYRFVSPAGHVQVGRGRTVNVSSGGVLFEAEVAIPVNTTIELSISWSLRSEDQVQRELHATGKTVRVEDRHVAVKFDHSLFRKARTPNDRRIGGNGR